MRHIIMLALLLSGCSLENGKNTPIEHSLQIKAPKLYKTLGQQAYETIALAEHVESIDLNNNKSNKLVLTKEQIKDLKALLLNDENYNYEIVKKVVFLPSYQFKMFHHTHIVTVDVSLPSKQVKFDFEGNIVVLDDDASNDKFNNLINLLK